MKRIILLALVVTITAIGAWAQAPQKFNYQGIARNASGAPLASQALGLRLTIIDGSPSGTVVYQETFTVTTNAYGLYNVQVGAGTVVSGTFNTINWANGDKYIQVEADPAGGTSYTNLGTSQLISAPYAVYANNAGTATMGGDITGTSTAANVAKLQGRNVSATAPTSGQTLTWDAGTSTWIPSAPASGPVTMGGDVTGTSGAATVAKLQGRNVSATAPTSGQVLTWDAGTSTWIPLANASGSVTTVNTTAGQLTGGPITTTGTLGLATTAVTAGTYGSATLIPSITVDAYGRITAATTNASTGGTLTIVNTTAGQLTGGPITTTGTLGLATTAVTAGTYGSATQIPAMTVDAYGRITGATTNALNTGVSGTLNYIPKFTAATTIGNSQLFDNGTSVGIGTTSPTASNKLHVINTTTTANQHAVHGISGAAASGSLTVNSALYGETSTGIGVAGVSGGNDGVFGYSLSGTAAGVEGYNSATNGAGVLGSGDATGSVGGRFTGGANGYGVVVTAGLSGFGTSTPAGMVHVSGSKDVTVALGGVNFNHSALVAQTSATTTTNVSNALVGFAGNSSFENHGIHAFARGSGGASFNVGVFASGTSSTTSTGNSYGVFGTASAGATNYGIYGTASTGTAYAGYFAGNVSVTGTMSKGGGTFKIDHPLDPENKYLYHSFVESPDMMNIYNGNIVTDAAGDAIVTLPEYFEALNRDFRYQLTVIGSFAQAIIYEKINNNQFKIKTDKPNIEVSWQITGVRHDKFADAHRVVPEVEKEPEFKGRYLHATEWGKPASRSIDDATRPHGENMATTDAIKPLPNPVPANVPPRKKVTTNTGR